MKTIRLVVFIATVLSLCLTSIAQSEIAEERRTSHGGLESRGKAAAGLAREVGSGRLTPAEVLAEFKRLESPTGLNLDAELDYAFAVQDMGYRLSARRKYEESLAFLKEAEKTYEKILKRTPDDEVDLKVMLLTRLATIRANYLGKPKQASDDFDIALELDPTNEALRKKRNRVGDSNGESFRKIYPDQDQETPPTGLGRG